MTNDKINKIKSTREHLKQMQKDRIRDLTIQLKKAEDELIRVQADSDKKISVGRLCIITTTKCNLNCPHCLRYNSDEDPNSYNDFFSKEDADKLLENVYGIGTLFFSGGEPLLNEEIIIYIFNKIIKKRMLLFNICIITNGTILSRRLSKAFSVIGGHIRLCRAITNHEYGDPCVKILVSTQYHNNEADKAIEFYRKNTDPKIVKIALQENDEGGVVYCDRTKKFPDGLITVYSQKHRLKSLNDRIEEEITVAPGGLVLSEVGFSFDKMQEVSIGNINEKNLKTIINEWDEDCLLTERELNEIEACKCMYDSGIIPVNTPKAVIKLLEVHELNQQLVDKITSYWDDINEARKMLKKQYPYLTFHEIVCFTNAARRNADHYIKKERTPEEYRTITDRIYRYAARNNRRNMSKTFIKNCGEKLAYKVGNRIIQWALQVKVKCLSLQKDYLVRKYKVVK